MATETITYTGKLVVRRCWCGIRHAIPEELDEQLRGGKQQAYCPLGHAYVLGESDVARLRRELKIERDNRARAVARRDQAEASARAHKGAATRARRERDRLAARASAGVCPCCGRTFQQLARHMAAKHPDYA